MKDKEGVVIYVGKAKDLRSRVKQYFSGHDTRAQVAFLVKRVVAIDFLLTRTETEALLLENSLIKKHRPKYNVWLKDDKTYQGLKLTVQEPYPRLLNTRRKTNDGAAYFGPFTSGEALWQVREFIDRYFQLRTCSDRDMANRTRPCLEHQIKRCLAPCVGLVSKEQYSELVNAVLLFLKGRDHELTNQVTKQMHEAAEAENFEEAARLRDLLASMAVILEMQHVTHLAFDFVDVIVWARKEDKIGFAVLMVREAKLIDSHYHVFPAADEASELLETFLLQYYSEHAFIPAEILVEQAVENKALSDLLSERAGHKVLIRVPKRGERRELLDLARQNLESHFLRVTREEQDKGQVLHELQQALSLSRRPERVECYDVSHISGQFAVASLVTFVGGEKQTSDYRRFRIRAVVGPDDFAQMAEVLKRRFGRKAMSWPQPDLIVVDGGRGQLSVVLQVLRELGRTGQDVIAIAKGQGQGVRAKGDWEGKKNEEVYLAGRKNPVRFKRGSKALFLLQQIRDEAHRFAIGYHRQLRDQALTASCLDGVEGIGQKRKQQLFKKFGSVQVMQQATVEALMEIKGITREMAERIKTMFAGGEDAFRTSHIASRKGRGC